MADDLPADFSIDYSVLHQVRENMIELAETAGSGGASGDYRDLGEANAGERKAALGHDGLSSAFNLFYTMSRTRVKEAKDGLEELGNLFGGVADGFFNVDSQLAQSAGASKAAGNLDNWRADTEAYEQWERDNTAWGDYLESIGVPDGDAADPDFSLHEACSVDDPPGYCEQWREDMDAARAGDGERPPENPGEAPEKPSETPPTRWEYTDESGTTVVELELDDNNEIVKETSTVTTTDGQKFVSETVYDGTVHTVEDDNGRGYTFRDQTTTTTYADGTTTTSETVYTGDPRTVSTGEDSNGLERFAAFQDYTVTTTDEDGEVVSTTEVVLADDGSGTMTITEDGKTTEYTRSGPRASWEEK
ncbi:serine/arginine repetitive matrix protein 2 [Streptomyces sp. ST2-7A]|uniref:serine/arginine repetitive matrix protein 2 n=1 Tax=Streptomyces sp. ST2-7A TaxID=2907214 RepID=UPI001F286EA2|nr:serine/arginine repetitive matrix protein 2 [Streptomyces sp. ST2-7A]MCE7083486.1 serine/arginine repetitive matrix protein 2 [Streptomyces sp. ST2-7A]